MIRVSAWNKGKVLKSRLGYLHEAFFAYLLSNTDEIIFKFTLLTLFLYFVLSCDYIFAVGMSLLIAWCLRGAVQSQQSLQPSKTHTLVP